MGRRSEVRNRLVDFPLFAYGTLRRGFPAHERYCSRARVLSHARVQGTLFEHEDGFPVLVVHPRQVLAIGSSSARADARLAERSSIGFMQTHIMPVARARPCTRGAPLNAHTSALRQARRIEGEVLLFPVATLQLAGLDGYEGYVPRHASLFARVLLDVELAGGGPSRAWAYVAGALMRLESLMLHSGRHWRPTGKK